MAEAEGHEARPAPEGFVVRRPIFDRHEHVVAYQLVVQGRLEDVFPQSDDSDDSSHEVESTWPAIGLSTLVGSRKACISCTRDLLLSGYARRLPVGSAVVNLPADTLEPDDDLASECRALRTMGHLIAIEGPLRQPGLGSLVSLADIIKVAFYAVDTKEKYDHCRRTVGDRPRLLAAEVDTRDQYRQALALGFDLVQGDFFLEPQIVEGRTIGGSRLNYLKLLEVSNRPNPNIDELNTVIESDIAITHRLLKYLGAAAFGFRTEIRSVRHGLALLGQRRIQSFVSLVALDGMCDDKPHELLVTAAVRGRLCELVGKDVVLGDREGELFLLGALSLLDSMLDQPMSDILNELPLVNDLKHALLGGDSPLQPVLQFVRLHEKGDWAACAECAHDHGIATTSVVDRYTDAVAWATAALEV